MLENLEVKFLDSKSQTNDGKMCSVKKSHRLTIK